VKKRGSKKNVTEGISRDLVKLEVGSTVRKQLSSESMGVKEEGGITERYKEDEKGN